MRRAKVQRDPHFGKRGWIVSVRLSGSLLGVQIDVPLSMAERIRGSDDGAAILHVSSVTFVREMP
jgi:hypothetical protein